MPIRKFASQTKMETGVSSEARPAVEVVATKLSDFLLGTSDRRQDHHGKIVEASAEVKAPVAPK